MNTDNIVVYESFIDPIKANVVKGLLDSYGIECFLSDENMVTLNAMYSQAIGGVKLNVFEKDIDRINTLLKAENIETETFPSGEKDEIGMVCPKCNSTNVGYGGSVKKKFGLWSALIFSLISIFVFVSYPFTQRKAYHCFECDHELRKA
jgi:hypothetical protein